jgi:hypothetical protein
VFHGDDVIGHLLSVVRLVRGAHLTRLKSQQLRNIGLGAFDPGAEDRLQAKVRPDEEVRIRDEPTDASEAVDRASRLVQ